MKTKNALAMTWMATALLAAAARGGYPELPVDLLSAGDFVILAETGISTVPDSDITGDMGVSPIDHTAITGFALIPSDALTEFSTSAQVSGKIYAANYLVPTPTKMSTAISNMETAYGAAAARTIPDTTNLGAAAGPDMDIGGLTIYPGLHTWSTGVLISTDVTLDGLGDPDAVFIFQISGDLTIASSKNVLLSGGAQAKNIFWQVAGGAGAIIDTYAHFEGIVMTAKAIVVRTGASFNGKLFAQTAVTLDQNNIVDANLIPPPEVQLEIVSAHGTGTPATGVYVNVMGSLLTNSITAVETMGGTQYVNTGWSMVGNVPESGLTNSMTMVHTNDAVLTWQWTTNYLLDASAVGDGLVTGDTNGFYAADSNVSVTAVSALGASFLGWTGNVSGPTNNLTQLMTMDQARTVVAHFTPGLTNVVLEIISLHGTGIPPTGTYFNVIGSLLTNSITAVETMGGTQYVNTGWSMVGNGPESGLTNLMTMVHTNDAVLTWQWTTNYLLDASAVGDGLVTGDTNGFYAAGSNVTVTAVSALGASFLGWTGNVSGPTNNLTQLMTMDQARTVVAHFTPGLTNVVLEIISLHGTGIPPTGTYFNVIGSLLTNSITAVETMGGTQYVNTGWSMVGNGPESGLTNLMTMVHTNDAVLTWQWTTNYLLDASAVGDGLVTGDTNGFYAAGSNVTVTAVSALGASFLGWTGNVSGPTNNLTQLMTMDQARTVVAHFTPGLTNVVLEIVSAHGTGIPPTGTYFNVIGSLLTNSITAAETMGGTQYVNTGWSMVGNGPESGLTHLMTMVHTNDAVLTWLWTTNYLLDASAGPGGVITGSTNGFYSAGATVVVTAVPGFGYAFSGWTVNGIDFGAGVALTLTMDEAKNVTATFSTVFVDVSTNVNWNVTWLFNPRLGYFLGTLTISNTNSQKVLLAPFWFEVQSTEWHWLRNPTGFDVTTDMHYLDISAAVTNQLRDIGNGDLALDTGESVTVTGIELMGRRTPEGLVMAVWADPPGTLSMAIDTDGDGMPDVDEYIAGTSATDPGSVFLIRLGPDGRSVQWDSQRDRHYTVFVSTNLLQGFEAEAEAIEGTGVPVTYTAAPPTLGLGTQGGVFFRVGVSAK
jgi:hypothetical protein